MARIIIFILLFGPAVALAEIYKTVDENGRVVFSDKPSAKAELIEVKVKSINGPATVMDYKSILSSGGLVVMYSTSWCWVCTKAKQYMASKGIRYKEYDIEKNSNAQRKFKKLGGEGVPLIVVGKQSMSGFSPSRLDAMLAKAKEDS